MSLNSSMIYLFYLPISEQNRVGLMKFFDIQNVKVICFGPHYYRSDTDISSEKVLDNYCPNQRNFKAHYHANTYTEL
jgi:hypothetical protein